MKFDHRTWLAAACVMTAADFTKLIAADQKRWAAVIKAANIQPE